VKINLKEMRDEMTAWMEARIDANNEKFEVLPSTLVSLMDIHQAMTEAIQEEKGWSHYEYLANYDEGSPRSDGGLSGE
jgi:hypothetical protein